MRSYSNAYINRAELACLHIKHQIIRNTRTVSLLFRALYAQCPYYLLVMADNLRFSGNTTVVLMYGARRCIRFRSPATTGGSSSDASNNLASRRQNTSQSPITVAVQ